MTTKTYNVLFLCTGNSARSIIAEAIMNHLGHGRVRAYSAGSHPTGNVNPFALETLSALDYPIDTPRSKSWDEFARPESPPLDFVFTVCDNAAGEVCPHWPGQPMTAHWGIEDPAAVEGSELDKKRAFTQAALYLRRRIDLFLNLPLAALDTLALQKRLDEIGGS
ncbi:MAG: arsenate reductase ArsC [Gammaproteobacteria bacterium]|nr:arsenate reductase ArsC [Gammaproteobacteria bacterium]